MAHRDTDTLKWDDPWFQDLCPAHKLLWQYVCDKCDQAGVWKENYALAQFQIGCEINWPKAIEVFGDRILIINGRWFILGFIEFHYGMLSATHKMLSKVDSCLKAIGYRWSIDTLSIVQINDGNTLSRNLDRVKDKDKGKDKSKDKDRERSQTTFDKNIPPWPDGHEIWEAWGGYLEMRKAIRKTATAHAQKLVVEKLQKLSNNRLSVAVKILNQSTANSWQGVFPLRDDITEHERGLADRES